MTRLRNIYIIKFWKALNDVDELIEKKNNFGKIYLDTNGKCIIVGYADRVNFEIIENISYEFESLKISCLSDNFSR